MLRSYFSHSRNLQINGDVVFMASQDNDDFIHVDPQVQPTNGHRRILEPGLQVLCDNTAPSARYGFGHSFAGPQCHPGTRVAVQDYIFKWLDDIDGQIAMWMNGPVGIGKSAIAQTVAHLAAERGRLSSSFFFFRSDDTRNSTKYLVPTLAYEMTQQIPATRKPVCTAIADNPLIFSSTLDRQISSALVGPLRASPDSSSLRHRLIIIDGLDECLDTRAQQAIIRSFILTLASARAEMIPHKILIVSRCEAHIASTFSAPDIISQTRIFPLDSWDSEHDIDTFLWAKLLDIKQTHPLRHHLPAIWPDSYSFSLLRRRSLGSFAYASVAACHIASHNHNPERALQDLLSVRPLQAAVVFSDLDSLYRHILLSLNPEIRFTLQRILCLLFYLSEARIESLAALLSEDYFIVEVALIRAASVIKIYESYPGQCLNIHHTSFEEFLKDEERSGDLCVFSPFIISAVVTALSDLWLLPITDRSVEYGWYNRISGTLDYSPDESRGKKAMDTHLLNTLAATKIPGCSLIPVIGCTREVVNAVLRFFEIIHQRSAHDNDELYHGAFNVLCAWLRSHLELMFQRSLATTDIPDILLGHGPNRRAIGNNEYPSLELIARLTRDDRLKNHFHTLCRMFPEWTCPEIECAILDRYLALSTDQRRCDIATYENNFSSIKMTLTDLYLAIIRSRTKTPAVCHRLERIVFAGKQALGSPPGVRITPEDCIICFFTGNTRCWMDNNEERAILDRRVFIGEFRVSTLTCLVQHTVRYIQDAHESKSFSYISEEVQALCEA